MNTAEDGDEPEDTRPRLEAGRLVLRPFTVEDEEDLFLICREKEIAANTRTIPHPYPRVQAAHWIRQQPDLWLSGKSAVFAICDKSSGNLLGSIGLEINEQDQNAELGYLIGKPYWGSGYCTEAATYLLRFGFDSLALHKIHAHYMVTNPASGRVMDKIGMKKEGYLRGHIRKWGQFYDVVFYGLVYSDYLQLKKAGKFGDLNTNVPSTS